MANTAPQKPKRSKPVDTIDSAPPSPTLPSDGGEKRQKPLWSAIILGLVLCAGLGVAAATALLKTDIFVPQAEGDSQMRALAERLAQVEGQRSKINALENSVNRLETTRNSLVTLAEKQESDVHRLEAALRERPAAQSADFGPLEQRITSLDTRLNALSKEGLAEKEQRLSLALSVLALRQALDTGRPFAGELALLKSVAAADDRLAALDIYAGTGLPTTAMLLQRFPASADAMLREAPTENAGWTERITQRLMSLVSVRRTGNVEGTAPDAILARAEFHLGAGDAIKAYTEVQALPDSTKARAADFIRDLAARANADALGQSLLLTSAQGLKSVSSTTAP